MLMFVHDRNILIVSCLKARHTGHVRTAVAHLRHKKQCPQGTNACVIGSERQSLHSSACLGVVSERTSLVSSAALAAEVVDLALVLRR